MWGILKVMILIIAGILLAQFAFNRLADLFDGNPNLKSWEAREGSDALVQFDHAKPAPRVDFIPPPMREGYLKAKNVVREYWIEAKRYFQRASPQKTA